MVAVSEISFNLLMIHPLKSISKSGLMQLRTRLKMRRLVIVATCVSLAIVIFRIFDGRPSPEEGRPGTASVSKLTRSQDTVPEDQRGRTSLTDEAERKTGQRFSTFKEFDEYIAPIERELYALKMSHYKKLSRTLFDSEHSCTIFRLNGKWRGEFKRARGRACRERIARGDGMT
jgi:hypothetical protein